VVVAAKFLARKQSPMPRQIISPLVCLLTALTLPMPSCLAAPPVDFQRQIQPMLAEHCTACHGVDPDERKSGLRLDLRMEALKGGESGSPAIVPERPDASEMIRRVISNDPDLIMPPKDHNKPLTADQIATLKQWISEGANYEAHWAFTPPTKLPLPNVGTQQPIDAFVSARLQKESLQPATRAANHTLCRRIYLDLTGLPPSPAELLAFEKDGATATMEKLLNSERFGEKWARHWLDLARYSDTNGYEKDLQREQWSWRDWVIDSINQRYAVRSIPGGTDCW
jgi:hypothetical protein